MNFKRTLMLIAAVAVISGAKAQTDSTANQGPLILTLDSAKAYAVEHSKTMRTASLNIQKAEWAKWQSISNMLLNVDGTLSYTTMFGYVMKLGEGFAIPNNDVGTLGITASATVNGQMIMAVKLSQMAIDMQKLAQKGNENDARAAATTAYLSVLIAQESKKTLIDSRENLEKSYNNVVQLVNVGMAEQTSADQIKVQLMVLDNNLRAADRNIQLAKSSLLLALGAEPNTELVLTESLDYFFVNEEIDLPEGALDNSITVQQLEMNVKMAQKQLTLTRWAYGPTLSVQYSYSGRTYFGKDAGMKQAPNSLTFALRIPIFSSGNRYAQCRQSKIDVDIAQTQMEQTMEQLQIQESQLKFNLSNAIETYNSSRESLQLYEKIFRNSVQKFNVGTISSSDLITVNNNLLNAQSTYIQSLYQVMNAQTELLKLYNNL